MEAGSGFFAAVTCMLVDPDIAVTILEKSDKLLAKVKVSGGERCNVTHACFSPSQLAKFYPRGGKELKKAFGQFNSTDTVKWFENRGVRLKTEEDGRMFPVTDNSQTIINCLMDEAKKQGVSIEMHQPVLSINKATEGFTLMFRDKVIHTDKVIVASGGSPKTEGFNWLKDLGPPSNLQFHHYLHLICLANL